MRGRTRVMAVAVALLVLAACGGDGDEPDRSAATTTTAPATGATTTTAATTESPPPSTLPLGEVRVVVTPVADVEFPTAMAVRDGDDRLYVAEKDGRLVAVPREGGEPATVLDLTRDVSTGNEQGLLGVAFSPDGRFLYVHFTDRAGDTRLREYAVGAGGTVDEGSARQVLAVDQPFANHNGGQLAFGPDRFLYMALGDGGSGGDPEDNAEDLGVLLGKILRIDPRPGGQAPPGDEGYGVPDDNPFVGRSGARAEIWAYGLRNPWRFSFDRETGDLWIGDVGQNAREEIDFEPSGEGGRNYGWDFMEGTRPFEGEAPADAVPPILDYGRDEGATVVGGFVYRGSRIPGLAGTYLYVDFYQSELRALRQQEGRVVEQGVLGGVEADSVASFGEDADGELYLLSANDGLLRLDPA